MRIKDFRVFNFNAFSDSGLIHLGSAMNLIVGQNNVGKSGLLKALLPAFPHEAHRSSTSYRQSRIPASKAIYNITFSGKELEDALLERGENLIYPLHVKKGQTQRVAMEFLATERHDWEVSRAPGQPFEITAPIEGPYIGIGDSFVRLIPSEGKLALGDSSPTRADSMGNAVLTLWGLNIFHFEAQRFSIGRYAFGGQTVLQSNAGNLPAVLATLIGSQPDLFDRLVEHVREVFPTVGHLSVANEDQYIIKVWPTKNRSIAELSFDLDQSGTGVSQVVAILCAVITRPSAIILIDEISSFLHPAATKALLRILNTYYNHHQYIVTTHSPEVISYANARSIHIVRRQGLESTVRRVDLRNIEELRSMAGQLGISMSDVFAADRLIWVEGQTEEMCFPLVYNTVRGPLPTGLTVAAVISTGDFGTKRRTRELVLEIYEKLSAAAQPLAGKARFSFDRETLSDEDIDRLKADSDSLTFLPRRHLECYLIDPEAVKCVIADELPDLSLDMAAIEAEIARLGQDKRYGAAKEWNGVLDNDAWISVVDAARLLKDAFASLTETRLEYAKTRHSLALLRWILGHHPERVTQLTDYVIGLIDGG